MKASQNFVRFLFLCLFFFTPLIFTQSNSELFELPKAYFVFLITLLITTFHLVNVLHHRFPLFQKSFINLPLFIFLITQTISTIFSIDPHTSFFGYYSRINGGLFSLICYFLLFFILPVYLDTKFKKQLIKFTLISGLLVSVYAIAQHFGIDKNWWVQDVQSRVFSTFGQPNWLAAYLCILLPFSIDQFFSSPKFIHKSYYLSLTSTFYLALLFTKSKSGIIACLISITLYFFLKIIFDLKNKVQLINLKSYFIFLIFIILSLVIKNPIKDQLIPPKTINLVTTDSKLNITPSQDIRKIVWQGAIDLWKRFPLFGTGVETFAYSYYWTRPASHNLTSEWDYLYNKAHNEYLNYLATTGAVGFLAYTFLIISVLVLSIKNFSPVILTAYLSILITNTAGFSVVTTSLFFFLLPSLLTNQKEIHFIKTSPTKLRILTIPLLIVSFLLIKKTIYFYLADLAYSQSENYDSQNDYQKALSYAELSYLYHPNEPLYTDKLASIYSKMALNTSKKDYVNQAIKFSDITINISPANVNFWKQRAQVYLYLSTIDSRYFTESITSLSKASLLAPTDAKIYYSIGQFLETANLKKDAIPYYQKAIELKPNYDYAYFALAKIYLDQKEIQLAKENLQKTIDYSYPTNSEAEKLFKSLR